VAAVALLL